MTCGPRRAARPRTGFSVCAAIRSLGRVGIAQIIDDCCDHARCLTAGMGALPGAEIVCERELNQGLVRLPTSGARTAPEANLC